MRCRGKAWHAAVLLTWLVGFLPIWAISLPDGQYTVQILSMPRYDAHQVDFEARPLPSADGVNWRVHWFGFTPDLRLGDVWQLPLNIRGTRPTPYLPWQSSSSGFFMPHEVHATVQHGPVNLVSRINAWYSITRFRQQLADHIYRSVARTDRQLAAVLVALTVGSRHWLEAATWNVFTQTGTGHLIAISGLHVGLVAGLSMVVFGLVWRIAWAREAGFARPPFCTLGGLIVATGYAYLAGLGISTWRAWWMLLLIGLLRVLQRAVPFWWSATAVLVVMLLCLPGILHSMSFWLSFSAVAWLAYFTRARLYPLRGLRSWLALQAKLTVALTALNLFFFQSCHLRCLLPTWLPSRMLAF